MQLLALTREAVELVARDEHFAAGMDRQAGALRRIAEMLELVARLARTRELIARSGLVDD